MTRQELLKIAREALGINHLNPMQEEVWKSDASRIILLSPTGSGKTLAFAGALARRLPAPGTASPDAIVMAPSRELVIQIAGVLRSILRGYKVAAFYGKHSMADEVNTLRGLPDVVVATPGRLLDHINRGQIDLAGVRLLAIDEYDKALEMGFHDEMRRICRRLSRLRFVILTSATPLAEMPDFVDMNGAVVIDHASDAPVVADRLDIYNVQSPARDKLDTLVSLLRSVGDDRTIVFVNHRESAERVHERLQREGFAAGLYHGGLEQQQREEAVICLNNGSRPILVATDLGARGLDIDSVGSVIHYHLPSSPEAWTHRNGRTARVDAPGRAFVITCEGEKVPDFIPPMETWPGELPSEGKPKRPQLVTLYINAGRREKISRADILGFLIKTVGLEPIAVGKIDLRDHASYVAVRREALPAIAATPQPRIKSHRVRISPL